MLPTYDYTIPSWFENEMVAKRLAQQSAADSWFADYDYDRDTLVPTPPPPYAVYGGRVADAYAHVAAALQGLFNANGQGWGPEGSGFSPIESGPGAFPGFGFIQQPPPSSSISPALYTSWTMSPNFQTSQIGLWSANRTLPDANAYGVATMTIDGHPSVSFTPGSDGYWWQNVYDAGLASANKSLDEARQEADLKVKHALARKGALGTPEEGFAYSSIGSDADAFQPEVLGTRAINHFENLINQDLSKWSNILQADWGRAGQGLPPRFYSQSSVKNGSIVGGISPSFFDPLISDAVANYNEALEYARNLTPDLGSAFYGAVARAERGGNEAKAFQGRPTPIAYFGSLARPGGFTEEPVTQEFTNIFPESEKSFSGVST